MSSALADLIDQERARGLAGLLGSELRLSVPVREALIQRVLATMRLPAAVRELDVRLRPGNEVWVSAEVQVFGFTKRLEARLRVASATTPGPPRMLQLAFIGRSLLSTLAGFAGPLVGRLPAGITIEDSVVTLDLDRLAAASGFGDLIGYVRAASFRGEAGVLWVDAEAAIVRGTRAAEVGRTAAPRRGATPDGAARITAGELTQLLTGLRGDYRIQVAESFANALLQAVLAESRARSSTADQASGHAPDGRSSGDRDPERLLQALGLPSVRFEAGVMIVEGAVSL